MDTVYLNGDYVAHDEAFVSVDDRGFIFADACYEAIAAYQGRFLLLDLHLQRLQHALAEVRIEFDTREIEEVLTELIRRNSLDSADFAMVYVQVTRGIAPRAHAFPDPTTSPTVYAYATPLTRATETEFEVGSSAVTFPDLRWMMPRIKTTGLLANVLAQETAAQAGAIDVVLHRDGVVTEGAHNNIFIARGGRLITAPADDLILPGVIRGVVIEMARQDGMTVEEVRFTLDDLFDADEVFFTGTTTEIRPTVTVDGRSIGTGRPGPVTRRIRSLYDAAFTSWHS
jgi:D-alanine transaminase